MDEAISFSEEVKEKKEEEMRHVKLYEEYSDEDLKDLMGDLEGIGHDYRLIPGQDFGFGRDLKQKNTGDEPLFLNAKALDALSKGGFFTNEKEASRIKDLDFKKIEGYLIRAQNWYRDGLPSTILIRPILDLPVWIKGTKMDDSMFFIFLRSWHRTNRRHFPAQGYPKEGILGKQKVKEAYDLIYRTLEKIKV